MNNDKKLIIKRLCIFLVIAFIPFIVLIPILWKVFGAPLYESGKDGLIYLVGVFGMLIPSVSHLVTRAVTKEGFEDTYLGVNVKGRGGYWLASLTVKVLEAFIGMILIWAIFMKGTSLSEAFPNVNASTVGLFLMQYAFSVIVFLPAFGEEWGWRGYMMPKLLKIMSKPAAIVVGGIIWGLWHAPLTVAGHNFGTDYFGYPFTGILIMCINCILMNAFLTLVTEKTRSVYPAAFIHALNNNLNCGILFGLFGSETAIEKAGELSFTENACLQLGLMLVTAVISLVLFMKKDSVRSA